MKKHVFLLWLTSVCLVALFSAMAGGLMGCQQTSVSAHNADSNFVGDGGELNLSDVFQVGKYYVGTVNATEYALFIESVEAKSFAGRFYPVGTASTAAPVSVEGKVKRDKCQLIVRDKKVTWKKLAVSGDLSKVEGSGECDKEDVHFAFKAYQAPSYRLWADSSRYERECFDVAITNDVKYGSAEGYWVSRPDNSTDYAKIIGSGLANTLTEKEFDLRMDIYSPKGDTMKARPLILFIHGGGFYIGDKQDNPIVLWCKHFAKMGYVVASINYRMGFRPSKESIERCGYRAAQDAHAAMRFLIHNKEKYRINPDYLFAAGSSAGGVTTLNLAFMRNKNRPESAKGGFLSEDLGGIASSGNSLKETFHLRCIANMWGAVHDISMIDNSKTAIISFHGNADQIVPYGTDVPFKDLKLPISKVFFNKMYGSKPIHEKAKKLGYRQELHTFNKCGHAPHVDENNQPTDKFYFIQEKMTDFFYKEFVPAEPQLRKISEQNYELAADGVIACSWKIVGGLILQTQGKRARVVWFADAPQHQLICIARLANGAVVKGVAE